MRDQRDANAPVVLLILAAGAFFVSLSCGRQPSGSDQPSEVELHRVNEAGLRERLEANRGDVILLDVWATWCVPCVEAWPKMLKLRDQYSDKGLTILSLSVNKPVKEQEVRDFLARKGIPGEPLLLDVENFNEFVARVGDKWEGGVPALLIYDRTGELQYELLGAEAGKDVEKRIREVLGLQ